MKNQILEIITNQSACITHDLYSKAEVLSIINFIKDSVGLIEEREERPDIISDELTNQLRKVANKFDFEYEIELNHDYKVEVEVQNAEDLVDELIDMINEEWQSNEEGIDFTKLKI